MGRGFGNLGVRIRHVVTFSLSPYEQRAFAGLISEGIPNVIRRSKSALYFAPGLGTALLLYYYGTKSYQQSLRKNPKDYENDV